MRFNKKYNQISFKDSQNYEWRIHKDYLRYLSPEDRKKLEVENRKLREEREKKETYRIISCEDCGYSLLPGEKGPLCIYCEEIAAERTAEI
ncbi:MAG: hypothetical protein ACREOB_05680, partial [Thermodesulfobacteriota bacterium]